jgi:hypothetical protein
MACLLPAWFVLGQQPGRKFRFPDCIQLFTVARQQCNPVKAGNTESGISSLYRLPFCLSGFPSELR